MIRIHAIGTICSVVMIFAASACSMRSDDGTSRTGGRQSGANDPQAQGTQTDPADPGEGQDGEGAGGEGADAGATGGAGGGAGATPEQSAFVRVAHLSPNANAVDVCIKKTGAADSTFTGPILDASLPAGVAFAQVTAYLPVPAGSWTARLVAPDAKDCATSLAGLPDYDLPALSGGAYATVAATGLVSGSPGFTVQSFIDRRDVPADKIAVRFVHVSPGTPAVDVGYGIGASFAPIWTNVSFGKAGINASTDANGFLVTDPLNSIVLSVRASGTTTDALVLPPVTFEATSAVSVFAIGVLGGASDTHLSVLACQDVAKPSAGLTPCVRVP